MKDGCAGIVLGFDTKDGCVVVEGCFGNGCVAVESWLIAAIMTNGGWGVCVGTAARSRCRLDLSQFQMPPDGGIYGIMSEHL